MVEEKISQEVRLKNIDKIRNWFIEETKQNELISNRHEKVCTTLSYIEQILILVSTFTECVSISVLFL